MPIANVQSILPQEPQFRIYITSHSSIPRCGHWTASLRRQNIEASFCLNWLSSSTPAPQVSCDHPLTAWKSADPDDWKNGKVKMVFRKDLGFPNTEMQLPCGQCAGCRLDRARGWAIRCVHEASMHAQNCFLTLTYRDSELPLGATLQPKDMQDFLKRLRKHLEPVKVRFFQCGEYGETCKNCGKSEMFCSCGHWSPGLGRPHHHCLLFGYTFPDMLLIRSTGENKLYNSATLDRLWGHGFCSIGDLTFDSACYVSRYVLKKITGDPAEAHYGDRKPEYVTMSRRPGIGREWYSKFASDLYNHDRCVVRDGFLARPPKYYDKLFELDEPHVFRDLKAARKERAIAQASEHTDDRRATKAEIRRLKQQKIPRTYEETEKNQYEK